MPGATVTVACKLPHGLWLQCWGMEITHEHTMGGGSREVKKAVPHGERVRINGNAVHVDKAPQVPLVGQANVGYALTHNVDADLWERWVKENADHDAVRNKMIWAQSKVASAVDEAKEKGQIKSGLEALQWQNDPRVSRRVKTADEQPKI